MLASRFIELFSSSQVFPIEANSRIVMAWYMLGHQAGKVEKSTRLLADRKTAEAIAKAVVSAPCRRNHIKMQDGEIIHTQY